MTKWETCVTLTSVNDFITHYDVGARGQLQGEWHDLALSNAEGFAFVLFEPDPWAASELTKLYAGNQNVHVIQSPLGSRSENRKLFVTRHATCSSLLEPHTGNLSAYKISPIFDVMQSVDVQVRSMKEIVMERTLPPPTFCKIDVQGAESLVLEGMGDLLDRCLCVELETHLYEIYRGQALLGDLVRMLGLRGLYLCDLKPQRHFEAEFVEANAIFCRRAAELSSEADRRKLAYIQRMQGVEIHPQGQWVRQSL